MLNNYLKYALIMLTVDMFYLFSISKYYSKQIKVIQNSDMKIKTLGVILCYLLLTFGGYYFSILKRLSIRETFFLGLFVYGVYELTNFALFKNWSMLTVFIDTLWGGCLFIIVKYLYQRI